MKVLCFIDSLGSGGAQRQLVTLAVGLKKRGHEIRFLVYHQDDHFIPLLQAVDIPWDVIPHCSYIQRVLAVRRIFRKGWQDVVLAFLEAPCFYAELAFIPKPRWGLVVGERFANPGINKGVGLWLRYFHRFADAVVCNSYTNQLMLDATFPFLRNKLCTVYNTLDFNLFRSSSPEPHTTTSDSSSVFRIVIAASYDERKNMMNVAKALNCLKEKKISIVVDWFGNTSADPAAFKQVECFISENGLGNLLHLHPATRDIASEFKSADAVGLFSFIEGLPNVICEGMACGKPILLSNVCDSSNLVQEGKNGFLCDPTSPQDIAKIIHRLFSLSYFDRHNMGLESTRIAKYLFDEEIVIGRYENILTRAANHEPMRPNWSWPDLIPESALKTVRRWAANIKG